MSRLRPPVTHCRKCGVALEVRSLRQTRVWGLFSPKQWQAEVVCPHCGMQDGFAWSALAAHHPLRHPVRWLLTRLWLRRLRKHVPPQSLRGRFRDEHGRLDLAKLVGAVSFPVYGLKGAPLGLRLRSPGWSGGGGRDTPYAVMSVHFGYVRGPAFEPEAAIEFIQGSRRGYESPLPAIESLLKNYAPAERRQGWFARGDFYQEWNLQRIEQAAHHRATIEVGGQAVQVEMQSWEDEGIFLAQLAPGEHPLLAVSLGLTMDELLQVLGTLAILQEDRQALAEHQRAFDANTEELRKRYT